MSAEAKRIALDVVDWMWGTVQGAFNDKMDVSQIITDAVVGMIPVVGDVTAVRDLIAISLGLAGDENKRQDKTQWLLLVVFIFALIPVIGGVIKGVGRLVLRVGADAAQNAALLQDVVAMLNRLGHGNAVKWLRQLDLLQYGGQVMERFNALMDTLIKTTQRVKGRLGAVLPPTLLARLDAWARGFAQVKQAGARMIPEALQELNARLLRLQQLVYRGEWHTLTPGTRQTTREVEARLIEQSQVAAQASAHGGWKQNLISAGESERAAAEAEIAKVYKWQEGYPDLMKSTGPTALEQEVYTDIAAFSGPIRASQASGGEYLLRIHTPASRTATGPWWVRLPPGVTEANWREFMPNGKQWRERLAVLEEFSVNGAYSVVKIKQGQRVKGWEGKAAEQFGMQNPGQYLPGGLSQLYLEAWAKEFDGAVEWVAKGLPTGWTDLEGVGYAAGNVKVAGAARVQRLAEDEEQSKRPAAAGAH